MKAVIMAGGRGTRLASVNADIPKPMFPIWGKPILEYQIESLKKSGVGDVTIIVGYLKEAIKTYFGDGRQFDINIHYIEENEPLGTAGALYYLKGETEDFVLIFGDIILDIDFDRFMKFHRKHGAAVTLFGHPNSHPYDSDIIEMDKNHKVTGILSKKEERTGYYYNFVNAGVYCISPVTLRAIQYPKKTDLEKSLIAERLKQGDVYAYKSTEYVKDMGTPERLELVSADVRKGIICEKNLRRKQRVVFLRCRGTICNVEAIKNINISRYLVIGIVECLAVPSSGSEFKELDEQQMKIETELGKEGAYLDDVILVSHPRDNADIFKPVTDEYNVDLGESWCVSNIFADIQTAKNAGMKTALIKTDYGTTYDGIDMLADYVAGDAMEAVRYIFESDTK